MQIEKKGAGPWADVNVEGVVVTLTANGESRVYDCAALQTDSQVTIDVVAAPDSSLAEGAANGNEYVATLIIPPKRYMDMDLPQTLAEVELPEDIDPACITPMPTTETVAVPLTDEEMEAVRLILWTIIETHQEAM